jgi:hypothetical protein
MEIAILALILLSILFAFWAISYPKGERDDVELEEFYQHPIGEMPLELDGRYDLDS